MIESLDHSYSNAGS